MSLRSTDADLEPIKPGIPRFLEAVLAAVGLVVTSPVLAIVALAVRVTSRGPILFRQRRVGRDGVEFVLVKFRTMAVGQSGLQVTADDDRRITRIGAWLRSLKLDELPELWNVVRGDMSFVGPRPEVPDYVDLSDPAWFEVLRVRPGITDPVTLQFRNEQEMLTGVSGDRERFYLQVLQPYKLALNRDYLRRRSFRSDLDVILQTLLVVSVRSRSAQPSLADIQRAAEDSGRP
jgi:lipopolysaccharide/colanic/teichoic acid biosynthesis glycosyltransferase